MNKFRKPIIWMTLAVAAGLLAYEARRAAALAEQARALQWETAPSVEKSQQLQNERDEATNLLASLTQEKTALQADSADLVRLRAEAPRLQEVSKKVARFEAAGGTLPQLERALASANAPETNRQNTLIEQTLLDSFARVRSVARLDTNQEQVIRDILAKQAAIQGELMLGQGQGTLTREQKDQLTQTYSNLTAQIEAVIPSDRRVALKEARDANKERDSEVMARISADGELAMLQSWIGTSREQEDHLFPILYDLAMKAHSGKTISPSEKANAVAKILTPTQTETYRKLIEENTVQSIVQTGLK